MRVVIGDAGFDWCKVLRGRPGLCSTSGASSVVAFGGRPGPRFWIAAAIVLVRGGCGLPVRESFLRGRPGLRFWTDAGLCSGAMIVSSVIMETSFESRIYRIQEDFWNNPSSLGDRAIVLTVGHSGIA